MLKADGFDDAVIGYVERCSQRDLICYDYDRCVAVLVERDGLSESEAIDFIEYNVVGAWMGEGTPVFLHRATIQEIEELYFDDD